MSELAVERPVQVSWAIGLLAGSVVAGLIKTFLRWQRFLEITDSGTPSAIFNLLVTLVFSGLIFWKIYQGRNWARVVFCVMFFVGMVIYPLLLPFAGFRPSTFDTIVIVLQSAVQAIALYLIFSPPGSEWFKKRTVVKASA